MESNGYMDKICLNKWSDGEEETEYDSSARKNKINIRTGE